MNHNQNEQLQLRKAAATPRGVGVMASFFAERAENSELWDVEGRRYIDFAGGIAVLNTGHRHPKVVAAVEAQLAKFTHTCYQVVPYESYISLAEKLNALTPGSFAKKTALFSTGAEAVENAVKIARAATGRSGIIAFSGSFHGRSIMAAALTGKVAPYKIKFGPFPPEIYHAPFPCHCADLNEFKRSIERIFKADIEPSRTAAFIFEPIQGEGGFNVIQREALIWLRKLCDEHRILLIADEVQTGFGRTGKLFAMHHYEADGVYADITTIAKSLAGGFTLAAVTGRAEIMDAPAPGGLGGTYAGSPVAIAAAHAVIEIMHEEKLPERGEVLGTQLKAKLNELRGKVPHIFDVRGQGAMVACEFRKSNGDAAPEFTKSVQQKALARNLILLTCGVDANVVRFLFPLTIQQAVFDEAMGILEQALLEAE
jgi:4-aminobutyrate aminotransferase